MVPSTWSCASGSQSKRSTSNGWTSCSSGRLVSWAGAPFQTIYQRDMSQNLEDETETEESGQSPWGGTVVPGLSQIQLLGPPIGM